MVTFHRVQGGTDVYHGKLKIAALRFMKKTEGGWPVMVTGWYMEPFVASNMSEALKKLHALLREPHEG